MIKPELERVIKNFEEAVKKGKRTVILDSEHRVEQVLRILKVDMHDFHRNEEKRAGIYRDLWQK
jgi:uncharacterized protein YhfF